MKFLPVFVIAWCVLLAPSTASAQCQVAVGPRFVHGDLNLDPATESRQLVGQVRLVHDDPDRYVLGIDISGSTAFLDGEVDLVAYFRTRDAIEDPVDFEGLAQVTIAPRSLRIRPLKATDTRPWVLTLDAPAEANAALGLDQTWDATPIVHTDGRSLSYAWGREGITLDGLLDESVTQRPESGDGIFYQDPGGGGGSGGCASSCSTTCAAGGGSCSITCGTGCATCACTALFNNPSCTCS